MRPSVIAFGRFTVAPINFTAKARTRRPRLAKMRGCHESHPAGRRQGHAAAAADAAHAEADRPDLRSAVSAVSDRPAAAGAGDRRDRPQPELPAAPHRGGLRRRAATSASACATSSSRRRSAPAARSSSRPADYRGEPIVVFNGDVFTSVDLPAVHRAAPRAAGQGDDRADAGRQSVRLRPGRDRRRRQRPSVSREAVARSDPVRHDQRRHLRARAGDARSHSRATSRTRSSAATSRR